MLLLFIQKFVFLEIVTKPCNNVPVHGVHVSLNSGTLPSYARDINIGRYVNITQLVLMPEQIL